MLPNRKECGTGNEMFCAYKGIISGTRGGPDRAKMRERISSKVKAMMTVAHSHHANTYISGRKRTSFKWVNCYIDVALGATPDLSYCRGLHLGDKDNNAWQRMNLHKTWPGPENARPSPLVNEDVMQKEGPSGH